MLAIMKTASAKPRKFGFIARTNLYRVCVASKYPVLKFSHSYVYSSVSIFVCRRWFKRAWLSLIIETSKRKLREGGSFECRRRVVKKLNPSFFRENKKKKKLGKFARARLNANEGSKGQHRLIEHAAVTRVPMRERRCLLWISFNLNFQ